jgi:hypothetical protein
MKLFPLLITLLQACIMEALVPTHTSNYSSFQLLFLFRSLCLRNMATPLQIGDTFPDILAAKNAIHGFMASNAESFKTAHSDKTRVILLCKLEGCLFRIRAFDTKKRGVTITHLVPHSCSPSTHYTSSAALCHIFCHIIEQQLLIIQGSPQSRFSQMRGFSSLTRSHINRPIG